MNLKRTALFLFALLVGGLVINGCSDNGSSDQAAVVDDVSDSSPQIQFLLDNSANSDVMVTSSGLQYQFLRSAEGITPNASSIVTVDYEGSLIDGTVFDSSYSRGEPATFQLSGTIDGFSEGIQLMSVGSQIRLVIPANLAYGDQGVGDLIAPGDTLIFEIELLEINSG